MYVLLPFSYIRHSRLQIGASHSGTQIQFQLQRNADGEELQLRTATTLVTKYAPPQMITQDACNTSTSMKR